VLDSTTRQGTYTTNQVAYSLTTVEDPVEKVDQGSVVINKILKTPNQGSVSVSKVVTIGAIETRQGIRRFNQRVVSGIEPATPTKDIEVVVPQAILIPKKVTQSQLEVPSNITIVSAKPVGTFTNNQDVPIQTLGYLADKASNVLFPTLNHGGELPHNKGVVSKNGSTPHEMVDPKASLYASVLLQEDGALLDGLYPNGYTGKVATKTNHTPTQRGAQSIKILSGQLSGDQLATALKALAKEDDGLRDYISEPLDRSPDLANPNTKFGMALAAGEDGLGVIRTYVDFGKQKGSVYKKERSGWNNGNERRKYTEVETYSQLETIVGQKESNPTPTNVTEYVVRVESSNGKSATFVAFLTSFSDSFTANWTDYNHVGQMDTFKVYKGATRQLSVGFKVVAGLGAEFSNTPDTAAAAISKLNNLINAAVVGKYNGNYVEGPVVTLTIAGLIKGIKCAIGSVKIDTDVAETGWTDGKPHVYSISLDATVLSHNGDKLFSTDTNYLG